MKAALMMDTPPSRKYSFRDWIAEIGSPVSTQTLNDIPLSYDLGVPVLL